MKGKLNTTEKNVDRKSDVDGCGTIVKKLPRKFEEIPGGGGNFRTNQPSLVHGPTTPSGFKSNCLWNFKTASCVSCWNTPSIPFSPK